MKGIIMVQADFATEINQSVADKLLDSTGYPLVVSEKKEEFPGCDKAKILETDELYRLSDGEIDEMFRTAVAKLDEKDASEDRDENTIYDDIVIFAGEVIEQAKKVLVASEDDRYEGPPPEQLEAIIDGGIEQLPANLKAMSSDWGVYFWCPLLRVTIKERPTLSLESPTVRLANLRAEIRAKGEMWIKFPWFNCYKWCLRWKKVIKCKRVGSISVSPDIAVDAQISFEGRGAQVYAKGKFNRLRLDYPILEKLPLESIANLGLKKKELMVYDARKLLATVPVLESDFGVKQIGLPQHGNGMRLEIELEQRN